MGRAEFEATLAAHGLAGVSLSIAHSATITARTLVQHGVGQGIADSAATRAAVEGGEEIADVGALPRISLGGGGGAPTGGASAADFELGNLLGEGGMGQVHLARQRSLRRDVAIKTTRDEADPEAAAALCAEGITAGYLEHPNILPVHALGRDDGGRPLLVMKRIEGATWQELLDDRAHGAWSRLIPDDGDRLDFAVRLLIQVCNAMSFAHSRGIVHRDLKPENVMIGDFGEVYVLDWGLAVPDGHGRERQEPLPLVGTPVYMAPEMVRGEPVGPETDVYLLGGMLHAALTGQPRHDGETLHEVLLSAFDSAPVDYAALAQDRELPEELCALANQATQVDRARRPASARALRDALERYLEHRASVGLSRSADRRFTEAQASLGADGRLSAVEDRSELYRAVRECRFAYRQALEQWPGNTHASEGLSRCAAMAVEIELADGHAAAARAALAEHPAPPAALEAAVAEAERADAAHREEHARLRSFADGLDPSVGRRFRIGLTLTLFGIALAITLLAMNTAVRRELNHDDVLRFGGIGVGAMYLLVAAAWRFTSGLNRRLAIWILVAAGGAIFNRVQAVEAGVPIPHIFATDMLLVAVSMGVASISMVRSLWPSAVLLLCASVACTVWPEHAPWLFSIGNLTSVALAVLLWQREAAAEAH